MKGMKKSCHEGLKDMKGRRLTRRPADH